MTAPTTSLCPYQGWMDAVHWAFIDVETTGRTPSVHGIIQISGVIESTVREPKRFDIKCRPQPGISIDADTLRFLSLTEKELEDRPEPFDAYTFLLNTLGAFVNPYNKKEKIHLVGYNVQFDVAFLRDFFLRQDDKYFGSWFWTPPIDVMTLAAYVFQRERGVDLPNFKLATVADYMGIPVDEEQLHNAYYDAKLCRLVYWRLHKMLQYNDCLLFGKSKEPATSAKDL